jgi:hypothetical protein
MDVDLIVDSYNEALRDAWKVLVQQTSKTNSFTQWLSSIHPQQLPCSIELNKYNYPYWRNGSFNACLKVTFSNDKAFMIRLPMPGKTRDRHLDEKVAAEVAAISIIRQMTDVPVPEVLAWGPASDNRLGLGPFMLVEYVQGLPLQSLLLNPGSDIMKADVDKMLLRGMFRRMIEVQLKLYSVDLKVIGSLDLQPQARVNVGYGSPPFTFKVTGMRQLGGIDGLGKIFIFISRAVSNTIVIINRPSIPKIWISSRLSFLPPYAELAANHVAAERRSEREGGERPISSIHGPSVAARRLCPSDL